MIIKLFIGVDKLDLFKDENINLNSSIADVSDITKNTTDFTKSFTVPASDNNNNIFKHYYNANIDGGFDARIKQDGKIELDGIPFKQGKWRLNSVKIVNGIPDSYNINFWGDLVNLKDILKNDELSALDLSDFNHDYTGAKIKEGLTSTLFGGDILYNLLVKKQYYFNSDPADNVQTETLANIALDGGVDTGIMWNDLRPSIRLLPIIEAIEARYTIANGYPQDIVFSRDFFGRSEFIGLYMYLNNSNEDVGGGEQTADWTSTDDPFLDLGTNIITYPSANTYGVTFTVTPAAGYETVSYTLKKYNNGELQHENTFTGTGFLATTDPAGGEDNIVFYTVTTTQGFEYTAVMLNRVNDTTVYTSNAALNEILSVFDVSLQIPKLKTIDFLKGLFNMFKLVVIPQDDGTIFINTLKDYYANGSLINITDFVDTNQYDVARGDILNEIFFKFQEGETILNKQFDANTGFFYGDSETYIYDDENSASRELLDGETLEFELPFEQVVYERLNDLFDTAQTNIQYGAIIDDSLEPVKIKPHIFYNIPTIIGSKKMAFIDENGSRTDLGTIFNNVSHVNTNENASFSTVFSTEINEYTGAVINNTLYSNYHQDYILSIFNIKRRNFTYKAKNFPLRLLTELSLNDVVQIKDEYFRIDKYDLNLLTGDIKFKLINSFDNVIQGFSPDRTTINTDYRAKTESIFVTNLTNFTSLKNDTGDGTGWVTVSSIDSNIYFTFTENIVASSRTMTVTITNDDTLQEFDVTLIQFAISVTWDNNTVTFDNNLLTWDNNI